MAVRIEKKGKVWTVIPSRPEARNGSRERERADGAFVAFDRDKGGGRGVVGRGRRVLYRLGPEIRRFAGRGRSPLDGSPIHSMSAGNGHCAPLGLGSTSR